MHSTSSDMAARLLLEDYNKIPKLRFIKNKKINTKTTNRLVLVLHIATHLQKQNQDQNSICETDIVDYHNQRSLGNLGTGLFHDYLLLVLLFFDNLQKVCNNLACITNSNIL